MLSIALSRRAPLGLTAVVLVVAALLLGGSQAEVGSLDGASVPADYARQLLYPFRRG